MGLEWRKALQLTSLLNTCDYHIDFQSSGHVHQCPAQFAVVLVFIILCEGLVQLDVSRPQALQIRHRAELTAEVVYPYAGAIVADNGTQRLAGVDIGIDGGFR